MDRERSPVPHAVILRRLEPEQNVARFSSLLIERDLFGRIVLVRQWGRIGSKGRERVDEHPSQAEVENAMTRIAAQKRRRGYRDL